MPQSDRVRAVRRPSASPAILPPPRGAAPARNPLDKPALSRRQRALDRELYEAAESGDLDGVREMLQAGANVNASLDGDGSPLIAAAREGRIELAQFLLQQGADPNLGVEGDGSALIAAAAAGHTNMVRLLLQSGADHDLVVPGDENPLIQASGEGHLPVVQLLVERGADVNARVLVESYRGDPEWRTPLGMAIRGGHRDVAVYLRSVGARE